jgi:very-short-patch-repair endonuclease
MPRVPPKLTQRARELRNNPTEAERLVWQRVSPFRPRFTREHRVGPYFLDIACRSVKLAIELDGSQHIDSEYDTRRTAFLEALGWKVVRFWNSEVMTNPDGVAEAILAEVTARGGPTHPRPLPSREGRRRGES